MKAGAWNFHVPALNLKLAYVSDLNSVLGVMPVAAELEIEAILKQLSAQVD